MVEYDGTYYAKYLKYKRKYIDAKYKIVKSKTKHTEANKKRKKGMKHPYYLIHTTPFDHLIEILKTGWIKPAKDIPIKYMRFGKDGEPLEYIFTNIHFEDLQNLTSLSSHALILSPQLIQDLDAIFVKGWSGGDFQKHDIIRFGTKDDIERIRKTLTEYGPTPENMDGWMTHEVLFSGKISLEKYLVGVVCLNCNSNSMKKVRKLATKYEDIFVTDKNALPSFCELTSKNN